MPLLCLVAQLHLQWNPSHLSEGKEFPLPLEEVSLHLPDLTNFNCDAGFQLLLLLKGHLSFTCGSFPSCFPFPPFQINASWSALLFLSVCLQLSGSLKMEFRWHSDWGVGRESVLNLPRFQLGLFQGVSEIWAWILWAQVLLLGSNGARLEGLNLFTLSKIINSGQHRTLWDNWPRPR